MCHTTMAQERVCAHHSIFMVIHDFRLIDRLFFLCSSPCSFPCVSPSPCSSLPTFYLYSVLNIFFHVDNAKANITCASANRGVLLSGRTHSSHKLRAFHPPYLLNFLNCFEHFSMGIRQLGFFETTNCLHLPQMKDLHHSSAQTCSASCADVQLLISRVPASSLALTCTSCFAMMLFAGAKSFMQFTSAFVRHLVYVAGPRTVTSPISLRSLFRSFTARILSFTHCHPMMQGPNTSVTVIAASMMKANLGPCLSPYIPSS